MIVVFQSVYLVVTLDREAKVVRLVRTAEPFRTPNELEEEWLELSHALDRAGRSGMSLLTDLRAAPGRNDPAFEAAMLRVRARVMSGFRRIAVLVQTISGALQIQRHAREDGIERMVGTDEAELLAYLATSRSRD